MDQSTGVPMASFQSIMAGSVMKDGQTAGW